MLTHIQLLTKNIYINFGNLVHLVKVFEHYNSDIQRDSNRASLQSMAAQLAQSLHNPCCCLSAAVFEQKMWRFSDFQEEEKKIKNWRSQMESNFTVQIIV